MKATNSDSSSSGPDPVDPASPQFQVAATACEKQTGPHSSGGPSELQKLQ
jgi:hypothetical protein